MIYLYGDISERIKTLRDDLEKGLRSLDADLLETASVPLASLQNEIRETFQENLRKKAKDIISKLKWNKPLSPEDMQIIEKWVVGDAEYYTEIENNYNDWVEECKRLHHLLGLYTSSDTGDDEVRLLKLSALLTDLKYTLDDVIRYTAARDRVERFRQSMGSGELDKKTKKWLAGMIKEQLASSEY